MMVKTIGQNDQTILIEWRDQDGFHRAYLPAHEVEADMCASPEMGIPYGVPWSELLQPTVTPEALEQALYAHGLWTAQDVLAAKPAQLLGVLQGLYGLDVSALIEAARTVLKKGVSPNGR